MTTTLARLWNAGLDMVFPPRCVTCKEFGAYICPACRPLMMLASPPRCEVCWMPEGGRVCETCRYRKPAFAGARAAFVYDGPARDAVLALKFQGLAAIARTMAVPMAEALLAWDPDVSAIVPVPLAGSRKRSRGYNQSELLAREISGLTGVHMAAGALARRGSAPPQVGQPDWEARRENVAGVFGAGRTPVDGGVLLIDDVITTGATLDACARVLLSAGSGPVFALTYARED
ncbi:MAG TPA: ComF family protein [Dehalococcoidia bacterium]|nr:ComF family protein [Dehalococcoidia bacterium]